ncbi:MAG: SRPBCC domain-containing protein [Bdellovibrionales bacterium]|nr:SRPBCC domain-containing protein [Bdellovibrionales bacterium]
MSNQFYKTADVKKTSATTLEIRRSFNAKPEMVYRAYTEPDLMRRWLTAYPGWEMPVCEMDLREGGKYHWRWVNAAN